MTAPAVTFAPGTTLPHDDHPASASAPPASSAAQPLPWSPPWPYWHGAPAYPYPASW
jgi:hypothetical protein